MELCPTLEEFGAIMGEPDLGSIILPTLEEDLSDLAFQLLGVPLSMAKRWCPLNKLNVHMVFKYFSQQDVPLAGVKSYQYLNAFFFAFSRGTSWCMRHLAWTHEFFRWSTI